MDFYKLTNIDGNQDTHILTNNTRFYFDIQLLERPIQNEIMMS